MKRTPYILLSCFVFSVFATHAETPSSNAEAKPFSIEEELSLLDKDFQHLEKQLQESINEQTISSPALSDTKKEIAALEIDVKASPKAIAYVQDEPYLTDEIADDDIALAEELEEEDLLADDAEALFEEMLAEQASESFQAIEQTAQERPAVVVSPSLHSSEVETASTPMIQIESQDLAQTSKTAEAQAASAQPSMIAEAPALIVASEERMQPASAIASAATKTAKDAAAIEINLQQVFSGSPAIYSILLVMSVCAVCIWLYSILSLRSSGSISPALYKNLRNKLNSNHFHEALDLCTQNNNIFCKMIASGIAARTHGLPVMMEAMKAEGKRSSVAFWQRLGLLNDIAIIAPMLGLLGTVLGMFYAFYDINRSIESVSTLFDGLGISVGTTVAGLIVAILALILQSLAKFRVVKVLATVENEAQTLAALIDDRTSIHKN